MVVIGILLSAVAGLAPAPVRASAWPPRSQPKALEAGGGAGPAAPPTLSQERRRRTFEVLDLNGDGFITRDELAKAFSSLGMPLTDEELISRMTECDMDGDMLISYPEFTAVLLGEPPESASDYGFRAVGYYGSDVGDPSTPTNAFRSAFENFRRELGALRRAVRFGEADRDRTDLNRMEETKEAFEASTPVSPVGAAWRALLRALASVDTQLVEAGLLPEIQPSMASLPRYNSLLLRKQLGRLTLSNQAVAEREETRLREREEWIASMGGKTSTLRYVREAAEQVTPFYVMWPYNILLAFIDAAFDGRPIARFYFLETVARAPYFVCAARPTFGLLAKGCDPLTRVASPREAVSCRRTTFTKPWAGGVGLRNCGSFTWPRSGMSTTT